MKIPNNEILAALRAWEQSEHTEASDFALCDAINELHENELKKLEAETMLQQETLMHNESELISLRDEFKRLKAHPETIFTQNQIEKLQSEVYNITGKGEVMMLFNKLLGVNAG
jgi:predicted nuclease with TOPRIM domain